MKKLLIMLMVVAMASFLFVGCFGTTPDIPDEDEEPAVAVTGVTLDQATLALTIGDAAVTLVATVAPADATDPRVIWASSDEAVAIVALGVVTPLNAGISAITATTVDGGFVATCVVTVTAEGEPMPASTTPVIEKIINVADEDTEDPDGIISLYSSDTQYMNEAEVADGILVLGSAPKYSDIQVYVDGEVVGTGISYGVYEGFTVFVAEDDLGVDGDKTLFATATEVGLDESDASIEYAFTLDTVAPELVSVTAEAEDVEALTGTGTITATFDEELDEDSAEVDVVDNWEVKVVGNPTFEWADEDEVSVELISPEVVGIEGDFTFADELEEGDLIRVDYVGEELTDLAGNLADESFEYCYLELEEVEEEVADLTTYEAALAAVIEADYTDASWTIYQLVVAANVVTDQDTQADVDAATLAITTAQGNLVPAVELDHISVNPKTMDLTIDVTAPVGVVTICTSDDDNIDSVVAYYNDETWEIVSLPDEDCIFSSSPSDIVTVADNGLVTVSAVLLAEYAVDELHGVGITTLETTIFVDYTEGGITETDTIDVTVTVDVHI